MAIWLNTLNLQESVRKHGQGKLTLKGLCKAVGDELNKITIPYELYEAEKIEIMEAFYELSERKSVSNDDFDNVLERLYDWGDTHFNANTRLCWIGMFS